LQADRSAASRRSIARLDHRADARLREKAILEGDAVLLDRGGRKLPSNHLQDLVVTHRAEPVLERLKRFTQIGSERRVAGQDLGELLEAGGVGHECQDAVASTRLAGKARLGGELLDEALFAHAGQKQQK